MSTASSILCTSAYTTRVEMSANIFGSKTDISARLGDTPIVIALMCVTAAENAKRTLGSLNADLASMRVGALWVVENTPECFCVGLDLFAGVVPDKNHTFQLDLHFEWVSMCVLCRRDSEDLCSHTKR